MYNNDIINDFDDEVIIDKQMQEIFERGDFEGCVIPNYLPYSHWRVKQIFLEYYGIELRPYFMWYKAMRYRSCQQYVLHDMKTNEVVGYERGYTLKELCVFLAKQGFPLHDDSPKKRIPQSKRTRNKNAQCFLEIVNSIEVSTDKKA